MKYILAIVSSFGGGLLVGGAYAAFITLLRIFPRLLQFTNTKRYYMAYEYIFMFSTFIFTLIYFFEFKIIIGKIGAVVSGLFFGSFLGFLSSALAETLNVLPVISKKFKIKKQMGTVFIAILLGKVFGSLYYFIFKIGG
ncbi:stage V sporulation protein AB [Tissierella sp. Yu-01]|uniref:stage V sporulation protein AB n=1 Tax=Tissierella sp. Yu-01 TaxID=3035694 RepID=UPI00240D10FD|nr:stage V sporulation protein AB [Tissierella sp. Yu-01]WFA09602.1 stage V sporulation protein AB [Tissierella sp. Yu-01]